MRIANNLLRTLFENVYFITGLAYAGKSTMARMLSEKHGGVHCGENYHEALMRLISPACQPNLGYFQTMPDWQAFIHRTPEAYCAWLDGCAEEAAELEIIALIRLAAQNKPVFVDTNIPLDTLREISDARRVVVMLSSPETAVQRFFDRPDADKQFLYQQILQAPDPDAAMANFRACISRANSPERFRAYAESGFFTVYRDDDRTPAQTMAILERHFGL